MEDEKVFCDKCKYELKEYRYGNKEYCRDCLLDRLEEESLDVETYSVKNYMLGGEHIGTDDDLLEVIENMKSYFDIVDIDVDME